MKKTCVTCGRCPGGYATCARAITLPLMRPEFLWGSQRSPERPDFPCPLTYGSVHATFLVSQRTGEPVAGGSVWRWALIATGMHGAQSRRSLSPLSVSRRRSITKSMGPPVVTNIIVHPSTGRPTQSTRTGAQCLAGTYPPAPPKPYRMVCLVARRPAGAMAMKPHHATSVAAAGKPIQEADSVIRIVGPASFVRRPRPPPLPSRRP